MKNGGKKILKVLGCVTVAALLFVAGMSIYNRIRILDGISILKSRGYYNPVDTGDHCLNVYRAGNENGDHTIVTVSGWSDGGAYIGWRPMTSAFEDDNEFIFVDRAGYGLSDDVSEEMTIEDVVEDYRTALRNSGEDGPYILMAHSMGSLYTAYWESTYPDEIEAVIIIDGSIPLSEEMFEREFDFSWWEEASYDVQLDLYFFAAKTGLLRLAPSGYDDVLYRLDEEDKDLVLDMVNYTLASHYPMYEMRQFATGEPQCRVWDNTVTNDIPKIYIATLQYEEQYEEALIYAERLGNTEVYELPGDHIIFLDRTEDCIDIIEGFLSGIE